MKKFKVILSVFMVILIILVSIMPAFAKTLGTTHQAVISEDLTYVMENSKPDEKIKVYIWYKDIDQDEVDALTTKATGLTPEKCAVIEEFPSTELLYSLRDGEQNAKKQMDEYMKRTESVRNLERERTDTYSRKHMEIANEKYIQKSKNVLDAISVSSNDVEFSSQLAPMIIAEMTKSEIKEATKNSNIEEINLYYDISYENPSVDLDEGAKAKVSMGLTDVYSFYGLSGKGVDVGLVEANIPGRVLLNDGTEEELEINLDEITIIEHEDYPITPAKNVLSRYHSHAYNTARVMAGCQTGIAKDMNIYATNTVYHNVEELIMLGVTTNSKTQRTIDVLEVNVAGYIEAQEYTDTLDPNSDWYINHQYAYSDSEKYYDHIVAEHNIVTVIAGGNYGEYEIPTYKYDDPDTEEDETGWKRGARVSSPGMAYNAITVGGYNNNGTERADDDYLCDYSWKNSCTVVDKNQEELVFNGCEKPDVLMPKNFPGGGTSVASPALTSVIALMLELKPSLSLHPEAIKAIVLASCHRKVNQTTNQGGQETMSQGITERQGAGAPDAWTMANIVCQGSYGCGVFTGFNVNINFVQPSYGANNMNISVSWIRENSVSSLEDSIWDTTPPSTVVGQAADVNLSVYRNNQQIQTSQLSYSSTEMCYIEGLTNDFNYQLRLTQGYPPTRVRYGYAWSTDNMYAPKNLNQDSISFIKNASNGKYLSINTASSSPQPILKDITSQSQFDESNCWIFKQNSNGYNILTGYGFEKLYFGQDTTTNGISYDLKINSVAQNISVMHNEDGTVCFLNSTNDRILSYSGSDLLWIPYENINTIPTLKQKWYLEKVNYLCGDANMDGDLEVGGYSENEVDEEGNPVALPGLDYLFVQNYIAKNITMNNLQLFLADMDKNGVVDLFDTLLINQFAKNKKF